MSAHGYGEQPADEDPRLANEHQETWAAYTAMQPAPGWQQQSIDAATAAARAKYALDKANGYHR